MTEILEHVNVLLEVNMMKMCLFWKIMSFLAHLQAKIVVMATLVVMEVMVLMTFCFDGYNFSSSSSSCVESNSLFAVTVVRALMAKMTVMAQRAILAIMTVLAIMVSRAVMALLAFLTTWTCLKGLES